MMARLWLAGLAAGAILFVLPAEVRSQDKPVPRMANGKPDLSGFWDTVHVVDMTRDYDRCGTGQRGCSAQGVKDLESLYTPYAAEENKKQKFD